MIVAAAQTELLQFLIATVTFDQLMNIVSMDKTENSVGNRCQVKSEWLSVELKKLFGRFFSDLCVCAR